VAVSPCALCQTPDWQDSYGKAQPAVTEPCNVALHPTLFIYCPAGQVKVPLPELEMEPTAAPVVLPDKVTTPLALRQILDWQDSIN